MRNIRSWRRKDNQASKTAAKRRRRRQASQLAFTADHNASTLNSVLQSMLTLYCLLMLMLGVVVPISDALAKPVEHADYRQLFYIFMHLVGIGSMVYMNTLISCYHNQGEGASVVTPQPSTTGRVLTVTYEDSPPRRLAPETSELAVEPEESPILYADPDIQTSSYRKNSRMLSRLRRRLKLKVIRRRPNQVNGCEPKILWSSVGVNLYLRFGAIIFGFGVMVHIGFKIADELRKHGSERCIGPWFLPKNIIDLLFITTQTYFLFKHHRVTINIHKPLIRFFLVHLAVSNLCIWVKTVIYEIKAGLTSLSDKKFNQKFRNATGSGYPWIPNMMNISLMSRQLSISSVNATMFNQTNRNATHISHISNCTGDHSMDKESPSAKLGPYLYPCAVEYGLICAAICYKFFTNVGDTEAIPYGVKEPSTGPRTTSCHKSHRGLFAGLIITICVLVPMISLLIMQPAPSKHRDLHIMAMLGIECVVLCCTIIMSLIGAAKAIRYLKTFKLEHHEAFDVNLLFIGLAGIICYNLFVSISVGSCLMMDTGTGSRDSANCQWGNDRQMTITKLTGLKSLADVAQSVTQTFFVMQSIQRKVTRALIERMEKPGRGLTTALLIVNLAMWIGSVFEFQRDVSQHFLESYFGTTPWSIIQYIFQPLIIFYRFHSTVCLSEIWVHSYKLPKAHHM